MVPLMEGDRRIGVIWVDDPRDRLLPTRARLQALRLFANQAVAAVHVAKQAARLRHEATHDALTGLPNRRAFRARLEREIDGRTGFALLLCDMDNLKTVNDTRGHDAGDKALQRLADALRNQLRRTDEAYRIGGDEFAIVLPKASRLDAERVMRRLREGLGRLGRRQPDDRGELRNRAARARRRPGARGRPRRRRALPGQAPARRERRLTAACERSHIGHRRRRRP